MDVDGLSEAVWESGGACSGDGGDACGGVSSGSVAVNGDRSGSHIDGYSRGAVSGESS